MKKVFFCLSIAAIALSTMVGCKPKNPVEDPNKGTDSTTTPVDTTTVVTPPEKTLGFEITVSEIDFASALINVKPSDEKVSYYWDLLPKEYVDEIKSIDGLNSYMEELASYAALYGMTLEDLLVVGEDEYTYPGLSPETEYVVFAAYYDEAKETFVEPVVLKEFKTTALDAVVPSDNVLTLSYSGDSILSIKATNNDGYYVEILSAENYEEVIAQETEAEYLEEMLVYYTEYDDEYLQYFIFSGDYDYNFWSDYGRKLEAGKYIALAAGISNYQVSTEVFKLEFTLPDLGVVSDDDLPELAPARVRKGFSLRQAKTVAPRVAKVRR